MDSDLARRRFFARSPRLSLIIFFLPIAQRAAKAAALENQGAFLVVTVIRLT